MTMTRLAVAGYVAAFLAGGGLCWVLGNQATNRTRAELQHWRDSSAVKFVQDSTREATERVAHAAEIASSRAESSTATEAANKERTARLATEHTLAQIRARSRTAADTTAILVEQDNVIQHLTGEVNHLREVVRLDSATIRKQQQMIGSLNGSLRTRDVRLASLDSVLNVVSRPPVKKKWFGLIPEPSRGVVFVVGTIGGVAATYFLNARR